MIVPEAFYQRALATHLAARGFFVREEFNYGRRRFDVVAFDGAQIHGFEVKCIDWRRAIRQAQYQQLCCDVVTIVVPSATLTESLVAVAESCGIGVATIGNPPEWSMVWVVNPRSGSNVGLHRSQVMMLSGWVPSS